MKKEKFIMSRYPLSRIDLYNINQIKPVVLFREPLDQITSAYTSYLFYERKKDQSKQFNINTKVLNDRIQSYNTYINFWNNFFNSHIKNKDYLIVNYQDLVSDTKKILKQVVNFFEYELNEDNIDTCSKIHSKENTSEYFKEIKIYNKFRISDSKIKDDQRQIILPTLEAEIKKQIYIKFIIIYLNKIIKIFMNYSKARNLEHLRKKNINVPKFIYFKVSSYIKNKKFFIEKIKKNFSGLLAIRSSASNEDTKRSSLAGYYDSFLNIPISDENLIKKHIDLVIKSYKKKRGANHEILVQKMVSKIKFSGVLLSRDINNYNPCYVINYSTGSDTSTVTSGKNKTQCIKYFINKKYKLNYPFNKIVSIAEKIKKLYRSDVDIEFIVDKKIEFT